MSAEVFSPLLSYSNFDVCMEGIHGVQVRFARTRAVAFSYYTFSFEMTQKKVFFQTPV